MLLEHAVLTSTGKVGGGLVFAQSTTGSIEMRNVECASMASCVTVQCWRFLIDPDAANAACAMNAVAAGGGNTVQIWDSRFEDNAVALSGYSGGSGDFVVRTSEFVRNDLAVSDADKHFFDCVFKGS